MSFVAPPKSSISDSAFFSTQPFLAWCLNHYVYDKVHYVFAARRFFPYKLSNPKSSNPYAAFQDFYCPCVDADNYDKYVEVTRIKLKSGLKARIGDPSTSIHPHASRYDTLEDICDDIDITFFWPIVYVIDYAATKRGKKDGSGLVGSDEVLIDDLKEDEFTVFIPDLDRENPVSSDFADFINDAFSENDAIDKLYSRS